MMINILLAVGTRPDARNTEPNQGQKVWTKTQLNQKLTFETETVGVEIQAGRTLFQFYIFS